MMQHIPRTMKAVLLMGHGGYDQLVFRDDVPVPAPAAGEVLIRVGAAAVNNTDVNTRTAWYSRSVSAGTNADAAVVDAAGRAADSGWTGVGLRFPRIQGADACGRIVAVGADVRPERIGERVLVEPVFRAADHANRFTATYFGSEHDGAFAQYACAPSVHAVEVDSTLDDVELASFPCSYSAAENMLSRLNLGAGETVLVTGASGGVGSAAVQLAARRGARIIAIAAAAKASSVEALGASRVLPRDADLVATVGRESVDAVVDAVGGDAFPALLEILRRGGRYAAAGAISGPIVALDLRTLYLKDLSLFGCTVLGADVFANLVGYLERGEIRPVVAAVYPLEAIALAQQDFLAKRHTGKIVLVPPA
jgi:NADPH:quinone reductase-like Zn-dependent oxidoreductase